MRKFEIINPSDTAFIEGDPMVCAVAVVLAYSGRYALQEVAGSFHMPIFMIGGNFEEWVNKNGIDDFDLWLSLPDNKTALVNALNSVHLAGEQTSLNDLVGTAKKLAERISKAI